MPKYEDSNHPLWYTELSESGKLVKLHNQTYIHATDRSKRISQRDAGKLVVIHKVHKKDGWLVRIVFVHDT